MCPRWLDFANQKKEANSEMRNFIFFELEKQAYTAGETIHGVVVFVVQDEYFKVVEIGIQWVRLCVQTHHHKNEHEALMLCT